MWTDWAFRSLILVDTMSDGSGGWVGRRGYCLRFHRMFNNQSYKGTSMGWYTGMRIQDLGPKAT